jgi:FtsP/CotA-like multicopper oxidase with cupredoxin domain
MPVPYTFAAATTDIPLSELDSNFATAITLGNTAVQLGNTVSTLNNMTLANVTISSGSANAMTLTNVTISSVSSAFPNSFLANSTATLGNATITLGGTTTSVGNLTLTNGTYTDYTESVVAIGNSSTTQTIALSNGTVQTVTLTANCTFTMPTAVAGKSFSVLIKSGAGGFTGTFSNVKWTSNTAPTITSTASRLDVLTFVSDGTNWYGNYAQNYTV